MLREPVRYSHILTIYAGALLVTPPLHVTAKDSGAGGRKFKSCHPDQHLQGATSPGSLFLFVLRSMSGTGGSPK